MALLQVCFKVHCRLWGIFCFRAVLLIIQPDVVAPEMGAIDCCSTQEQMWVSGPWGTVLGGFSWLLGSQKCPHWQREKPASVQTFLFLSMSVFYTEDRDLSASFSFFKVSSCSRVKTVFIIKEDAVPLSWSLLKVCSRILKCALEKYIWHPGWPPVLVRAGGLFSLCAQTSKRFSLRLCRENTNESGGRVQMLVEEHMGISLAVPHHVRIVLHT